MNSSAQAEGADIRVRDVSVSEDELTVALMVSGDRVNPSRGDIRNPATLRSRGEAIWLTR